jgi:hypothetical protein
MDCLRAATPVDPNLITIETALIERPLGDSYIGRELWQDTDELLVGFEQRQILQENGLRVGQLVGPPPVGFQTLLLSPRCCSNPARLVVPNGRMIPQYLGPIRQHASFEVASAAGKIELEADQVRFGFEVVPTLTNDGRTRLTFTPTVETGEKLLPFQASPEQSSWVLRIERPSRKFEELTWEVTLAPGEYVVVGCLLERRGSLGESAFVEEDAAVPTQRLLVIRTNRACTPTSDLAADEPMRTGRATPLAVQAAQPIYRTPDVIDPPRPPQERPRITW